MPDFFIYILKCNDDSYYIGHTDDLEKRVEEHASGSCSNYTSTRLPVKLVFTEAFQRREDALAFEIKIKKWSRVKKEALINRDFEAIRKYAKKKF
jgi:predicted GIY-YIG superfamily endonuclease